MNIQELKDTVKRLMASDKGLLAMDESTATCNNRFKALNIPQTEGYRRKYRELIVTAPNLEICISGAILFDETIKQSNAKGKLFIDLLIEKGIIPGIKVDEGTVPLAGFPDEKITEGLDGLRERLIDYYNRGARFAKWRAVFAIGKSIPTRTGMRSNAHLLARYAALCQEVGLVPIVEPEVLMEGDHTLEKCAEVTSEVLTMVFEEIAAQRVCLEGMLLKPNMILPGISCPVQVDAKTIARTTVECFLRKVPAAVGGIAFLSGGQSPQQASERLNAIYLLFGRNLPWPLTFSFSRALQQPALERWKGESINKIAAQKLLYYRSTCNQAARRGGYTEAMEQIDIK